MSDLFELTPPPRTSEAGDGLNAEQRVAVRHGEGPLLVVAGAGTGKTRVIVERIRHLLESDPDLPPESIVGLTFTDKAAGEMKHRVAKAAGERGKGVFLGTFHAFCTSLLIERNPSLKPLEEVDHWILLRRNLRVLELYRYLRLSEPGKFLSDFVKFFSRCQDELVSPAIYQRYADSLAAQFAADHDALPDDERLIREEAVAQQQEIARAYRASDRLLRERGLLTFGMQLHDAVRALDDDPEFAARLRKRFRYILVDEFQDTNVAQIELLWRLASDHRNIVAVGDNAQAIYRFRGASFSSFTIFLERFAGVPRGDSAAAAPFVQPLVNNYRSSARILRTAGQIVSYIERSPLLPKKELVPHKPDGEKVRIAEFSSAADEARWIAAEIERLHDAGQRWSNFAALYRIHSHREQLVAALGERNIPFVIRNHSIVTHPLVRDLLAYLRLLADPWDNIACARVLAAPAWGFEPADLVRLTERAGKTKPRSSLWDALQAAQAELPFSGEPRGTDELVAGLNELRRRERKSKAMELFDALAEWLNLALVVSSEDRRYLDRLRNFLREWHPKSQTGRLAEFVEYLDFFEQAGGQINLENEGGDAVQLMTVHSAKGLEFGHVFVLRLTSKAFPQPVRKSELVFPAALMKEEQPQGDFHIQEERRLFYVAITRAQQRLTLTTVIHKRSKPSIFLDDILSSPSLVRENVEQLRPAAPAPPVPRHLGAGESGLLFAEARGKPRVNSRIGEWAQAYRPPVFEPLQLSSSAIETYQKCPQQYLFARVWGLPTGPFAATTFGNVMHTAIRYLVGALHMGQPMPFEDLEIIFRREWTSAGFEDDYQEELYQRDGLDQLRAFHAACVAAPPDVFAQEKFFTLDLENGVQITGRMDQINRVGQGQVEIVDYKTGKGRSEEQARKDLQLGIYALGARQALELDAVRLIYHNLQSNRQVVGTREEKQLNEVRGIIQEVAADIRAREFPAKPGFFACSACEFRLLCPVKEARRGMTDEPDAIVDEKPSTVASNQRAKSKSGAPNRRPA